MYEQSAFYYAGVLVLITPGYSYAPRKNLTGIDDFGNLTYCELGDVINEKSPFHKLLNGLLKTIH